MQPQLPIDVDPETGVWTTDALPMLYVPRHFFTNNHVAVEEALGREAYADILYKAGYKSAYHWCDKEAKQHGLSGMAVFEHYLKRLSQRGWGLFSIVEADPKAARAHRTEELVVRSRSAQQARQALLHVCRLVRGRDGLGQRYRRGRFSRAAFDIAGSAMRGRGPRALRLRSVAARLKDEGRSRKQIRGRSKCATPICSNR